MEFLKTDPSELCWQLQCYRYDSHNSERIEQIDELIKGLCEDYGNNINEIELSAIGKNRRNAGRRSSFTEQDLFDIKQRRDSGDSLAEIAKQYDCSISCISKLLKSEKIRKLNLKT